MVLAEVSIDLISSIFVSMPVANSWRVVLSSSRVASCLSDWARALSDWARALDSICKARRTDVS